VRLKTSSERILTTGRIAKCGFCSRQGKIFCDTGQARALSPAAAVLMSLLLIFLAAWNAGVVIPRLFIGPYNPQKIPLPWRSGIWTPTRFSPLNGISIGSTIFVRTWPTDRLADTQTDKPTTLLAAMRPTDYHRHQKSTQNSDWTLVKR